MNFNISPFMVHEQYFKLTLFLLSYFLLPIILISVIVIIRSRTLITKMIFSLFLICSITLFWARFCEPYMIKIENSNINIGVDLKIALISDLHLGLFKNEKFLNRVIEKIEREKPDMIFIAGDLTYWPEKTEIDKLFSPFKNNKIPVYAVLGNHDVSRPGPVIRTEIESTMKKYNINLLNNDIVKFADFTLIGLGSKWNNEDQVDLLDRIPEKMKVIVLAHNPDTAVKYRNRIPDVTLCGHLHGGQIRIPILYKKALPTAYGFDTGLNVKNKAKIYVTAGLGEVGLPMRFLNPPVIDIIDFRQL